MRQPSLRFALSFVIAPLILSLLTTAQSANAEDAWSKFRGPNGDGVAQSVNLPTEWSSEKNIVYRTELPGNGWSSPVIGDGKVYLSAAIPDGEDRYQLSLLILDAKSGDLLKNVPLIEQTRKAKIHKKNSHASPTLILDGDRIYTHFGYQGTVCTDREGSVIWKNRDLRFKPVHGNGGTPVLVNDKLIFTCDGASDPKVVALNTSDGKLAWERKRPVDAKKKFSFCTPTVITVKGAPQVVTPGSDCVLGLNPDSGDVIWQVKYTGYSVVPKPIYHQSTIFLSTGFDKASMLAIDPTGNGDVTDSHVKWQISKNVPKTPSMLAHDGLIYSVADNGIAMCVEADTGDLVYQKRIGSGYSASPFRSGNRLYFTDEAGKTTVLRVGRKFDMIAENDLDERTLATAGVDGSAIIMRTEKALYRIQSR